MECQRCSAVLDDGAVACTNCGTRVCPACGTSASDGDTTCSNCGSNLSEGSTNEPVSSELASGDEDAEGLRPDPVVDGYRVVRRVGGGSFGSVYKVIEERTGETFAMKWFRGERSQAQLALLRREVRASQQVRVREVVGVIGDVESRSDGCYILMEYLEGESLREAVERRGSRAPVDLALAEKVLRAVCKALSAIHAENLIHRDVKPANIFVCSNGEVKLLDLGIARRYEPGTATTSAGTVGYAAEEQLRGRPEPRSDIYGLGATLYELLTGLSVRFARDKSPSSVDSTIPKVWDEITRVATAPDCNERYPDASSMLAAFDSHGAVVVPERVASSRSRGPVVALIGLVALIGSVVGASRFLSREAPLPSRQPTSSSTWTAATPTASESTAVHAVSSTTASASASVSSSPSLTPTEDMVFVKVSPEEASDASPPISSFWIDKYEVDVKSYDACVKAGWCTPAQLDKKLVARDDVERRCNWAVKDPTLADHPVNCVTLQQAKDYCGWRAPTGTRRLPTDEEWLRAALGAGLARKYPWGDGAPSCDRAVYRRRRNGACESSGLGTASVDAGVHGWTEDTKIFGMLGNVWEWTTSEVNGPGLRGGSWDFGYEAFATRLDARSDPPWDADHAGVSTGFRCARSGTPASAPGVPH